jgi:hypothetical protein
METEQVPAKEQAPPHPAKARSRGQGDRSSTVKVRSARAWTTDAGGNAGDCACARARDSNHQRKRSRGNAESRRGGLGPGHGYRAGATPEQAPLHPAKVGPELGVAVRMTEVPLLKFAVQTLGQVMPPGALVTEPEPVRVTAKGKLVVLGTLRLGVSTAKSVQVPVQLVRLNSTEVMLAPVWSRTPM